MYWQRDTRKPKGGFFYCAVRARERSRNVYDQDPIYRIGKRLRQASRERRTTVERMARDYGALQTEG